MLRNRCIKSYKPTEQSELQQCISNKHCINSYLHCLVLVSEELQVKKVLISRMQSRFHSKCPIFNSYCEPQMCACVHACGSIPIVQDNQANRQVDGWAFVTVLLLHQKCSYMCECECVRVCLCLFINGSHQLHVNRFAILFITCFAYRCIHRLCCDGRKSIVLTGRETSPSSST